MEMRKFVRIVYFVWAFVSFLIITGFFTGCIHYFPSANPKTEVIKIGKYKGQVYPEKQVSPGTFTIIKKFEEVSGWGEEAIMTYSFSNNNLNLKVWNPSQNTSGVFEYSEKSYFLGGIAWRISDVSLQQEINGSKFFSYTIEKNNKLNMLMIMLSLFGVIGFIFFLKFF